MLPLRILTITLIALAVNACSQAPRTAMMAPSPTTDVVVKDSPPCQHTNRITDAEMLHVVRHIARCWPTALFADGEYDLELTINPDGTIADAKIGLPENAAPRNYTLAGLKSRRCSPLPLPPEKYEAWHHLSLYLTYKTLLNGEFVINPKYQPDCQRR